MRRRSWLSPYLLAIALSPAMFQTSETLSCGSGDTSLAYMHVVVTGDHQLDFDPDTRSYSLWLLPDTERAWIRAIPKDPDARVWINLYNDAGRASPMAAVPGGGDAWVTLRPGLSELAVYVKAPGGKSDSYTASIHVGSTFPCTENGVRDAIAEGGGVHRFDCDGSTTVTTEATIVVDNDVVLDGQWKLSVDGAGSHKVFHVHASATAELRGLTITGGASSRGAGISNAGTLSLVDCTVTGNVALTPFGSAGDGGGISNGGAGSSLHLNNTVVIDNTASRAGGGLINSGGPVTIVDSVISGNHAQYGGGIFQGSDFRTERLTVLRSIISDNSSDWRAGGIYAQGHVTILESTIANNFADDDGGGIFCHLSDFDGETLAVTDTTIADNHANLNGGGVYCHTASGQFRNSTISNNTALDEGGGLYFGSLGRMELINVTVSGNRAAGLGGGVVFSDELDLINATLVDNVSDLTDEASAIVRGSMLRARNSVIAGGCVRCWAPPGSVCVSTKITRVEAAGLNVESPGESCFPRGYALANVDTAELGLGPLQHNGGPTKTRAPLPNSAIVDAVPRVACTLNEDQRGALRPNGAMCDIGAVERQAEGTVNRLVPSEYPSIQSAISAAEAGDTIHVGPGVYQENLDFLGKDITLVSAQGPVSTVIDANGGLGVLMGPGGALVGFTVTNGAGSFEAGAKVMGEGSLIAGNVFDGNAGSYGAGVFGNVAAPIIDGNVFRNHQCADNRTSGVIVFFNRSAPIISNNVFDGNACRAINMTVPLEALPLVINNTIVNNDMGIRVDGRSETSQQVYRNNILFGNGVGFYVEFGSPPTWEHNLVFGNGINYDGVVDPTGNAGNISVDPGFADPSTGDYHLVPPSDAVDAGNNDSLPHFDFDGQIRVIDGYGDGAPTVDLGAFEFR